MVENFRELPAAGAPRIEKTRSKGHRGQELPRYSSSKGPQERGGEEQGPLGSRASQIFQQQGSPGVRERRARAAGGESFQDLPAAGASRNEEVWSKGRRGRERQGASRSRGLSGEGEGPKRRPNPGQTEELVNGQVRASTPADGKERASRVWVESFLRFSGREEEELEERRRHREEVSREQDPQEPEQGRGEDWSRSLRTAEVHLLAQQPSGRGKKGRGRRQG